MSAQNLPSPTPIPGTNVSVPTAASVPTKIAFSIGAGALLVSPTLLPYSTEAAGIVAAIGGAATALGGLIHAVWDHSP